MRFDPMQWLVSFAGFIYDWIITREWRFIFLALIPALFLTGVGGFVWMGSTMNTESLAQWYIELGDQEIGDWEQSLTQSGEQKKADAEDQASALTDEEKRVSPFAEALFRRVQMLSPNNRSKFVIGAILAQRGAIDRAKKMLLSIAPNDRSGSTQAHAFLALIYMQEIKKSGDARLIPMIRHHATEGAGWSRAPDEVLMAAVELHLRNNDQETALKILEVAAERKPELYLELARRSRNAGNQLRLSSALAKAEAYLSRKLDENSADHPHRVQLAEIFSFRDDNFSSAEELILQGLKIDSKQVDLRLALSEIYRLRFLRSIQESKNGYNADVALLDKAMNIDPTNARVAEEVAKLASMQGVQASDELIAKLKQFLAEGTATSATHAWLSEAYITKNNKEKAVYHLEQVVLRLPTSSQHLNNLAFLLAENYPDRIDEAIEYARRAVKTSMDSGKPVPDYYDTLGYTLSRKGNYTEAIAALETAIQLSPRRPDFHKRIAEFFAHQGDREMAANHIKLFKQLTEMIELQQAAAAKAKEEQANNQSSSEPQQ